MKIPPFYLLVFLMFVSCSRNDKRSDSTFENLTDKYFIMKDAVSEPAYPLGNGTSSVDLYHDWYKDPCILDDLRMFKSNGDYLNDNGATKCDPSEPQTATLTWRLIENNTKIETTQTPNKDTLTILINDGNILKYRKTQYWSPNGTGVNYTWTITWQKHN